MKILRIFLITFSVILSGLHLSNAQTIKADKKAAKIAALRKHLEDNQFTFEANYVNPQRGGNHSLTSEYDLRVTKDTIICYLPYFGTAYVAPTNPLEGGIKFTTTQFSYVRTANKHGGWSVVIRPKDSNVTDMKDVRYMRLDITNAGYASLQVISTNRDEISFDGVINE